MSQKLETVRKKVEDISNDVLNALFMNIKGI